jgi:hypothetical protein
MDEQLMKCMPSWKKLERSNEQTLNYLVENLRGNMNQGIV